MKIDESKVIETVKPIIESLGYQLVAIKSNVQYGTDTLSVIIYKEGDMGLNDCETVHNAIDKPLDDLNPTGDKPYNLEVSSMGLDWNLKTDEDFNRRLGQDIEVSLFAKIDNQKKFTGILISFDENSVTLDLTDVKSGKPLNKTQSFDRKAISKAIAAIRFE